MAEKLLMLALSPTMESGTIVRWHVDEGTQFKEGDVLCEVETDKATMDYETTTSGTIRKIIIPEGNKVQVGEVIAIAGESDEDISSLVNEVQKAPAETVTSDMQQSKSSSTSNKDMSNGHEHHSDFVKASPLARVLAKDKGIDIASIAGSGPGGRVVKADIERVAKTDSASKRSVKKASADDVIIPVTEKRQIIASRLVESKQTSPHFYLTVKTVMDDLLAARQEINAYTEPKLSLNAFFIKLVAQALFRHPEINTSWAGDTIIQHHSIDVALAVAQPDGLVTPVIRDAASKGIVAIDNELHDLIARAREGKLAPEEYKASTFTISNLGSYGVHQFTAIINPPNAAILAVGEVFREPFEGKNESVAFRSAMYMTLSCDHRLIDGTTAALFARDLKKIIEHPVSALL